MAKNISYFAEERRKNNDPNFFKKLTSEMLMKQVKRIVRDIRYGNLEEQDLIYFKNDKIISACIAASNIEWINASIEADALRLYLQNLSNTMNTYDMTSRINLDTKCQITCNLCNKYNTKTLVWQQCYIMFSNLSNLPADADVVHISNILQTLFYLDMSMFRDL